MVGPGLHTGMGRARVALRHGSGQGCTQAWVGPGLYTGMGRVRVAHRLDMQSCNRAAHAADKLLENLTIPISAKCHSTLRIVQHCTVLLVCCLAHPCFQKREPATVFHKIRLVLIDANILVEFRDLELRVL